MNESSESPGCVWVGGGGCVWEGKAGGLGSSQGKGTTGALWANFTVFEDSICLLGRVCCPLLSHGEEVLQAMV